MVPLSITFNNPNPNLKVTPLFDAESQKQDTDVVTVEY